MKFIKHLYKDLTPVEFFIAAFSYTSMGIGLIILCLTAWDFLLHVFGN